MLNSTQFAVNLLNHVRGQNLTYADYHREFKVDRQTKTLYLPLNDRTEIQAYNDLYYSNPVINADARHTVRNLYDMGYRLFTMGSATLESEIKKTNLINQLFDGMIIPKFAMARDKTPYLLSLVAEYNLNPKQTLFIDDSITCLRQGRLAKFQPARMMGNGTLPSPRNLRIPHFTDFKHVQDYVMAGR